MNVIIVSKNKERCYHTNEYGSNQTVRANTPRSSLIDFAVSNESRTTWVAQPLKRGLYGGSNSISSEFDLRQIRWKLRSIEV